MNNITVQYSVCTNELLLLPSLVGDTSQPIGEQFSFDDVFDIKYKPKYFTAKWVGRKY